MPASNNEPLPDFSCWWQEWDRQSAGWRPNENVKAIPHAQGEKRIGSTMQGSALQITIDEIVVNVAENYQKANQSA